MSFERNTEIFKAAGDRASDALGTYKSPFKAKQGRKLAVTGRSLGRSFVEGTAAGAVTGLAAGAATGFRSPGVAAAGNAVGNIAGGLHGQARAFRNARSRGDLKPGA